MKLYWLDLETTGLSPAADSILEVAVSVSELSSPFDARPLYHAVLHTLGMQLRELPEHVREMHTKNGLWGETKGPGAKPVDVVEDELLALVAEIESYDERPVLAGASVHFDAGFLGVHMPVLVARFHHRHYDVSAIKLFCQSLGMPKIMKGEAHRAQADVLESIWHAEMCARWLRDNWAGNHDESWRLP